MARSNASIAPGYMVSFARAALDIGVPRRGRCGGQGEPVSVGQHDHPCHRPRRGFRRKTIRSPRRRRKRRADPHFPGLPHGGVGRRSAISEKVTRTAGWQETKPDGSILPASRKCGLRFRGKLRPFAAPGDRSRENLPRVLRSDSANPGLRDLQENGTWPLSTISTASRNGCANSKRLLQRVRMKSPNWRNGAISQGKPHAPMSKTGEGASSTIHRQGSGAHRAMLRSRGISKQQGGYSHGVSAEACRPDTRPKARHSPILPVPW